MANLWNTIHIFGFGTVQAISDDKNVQAPIEAVQAEAQAVIDDVWANKPEGYEGPETYHAINNFYDMFSDWYPAEKGYESFRVDVKNLDKTLFDALAEAVFSYVPPVESK